jgi:hypothetical protein
MPMDEELLRAMIRESVARHLQSEVEPAAEPQLVASGPHASHYRYALPDSGGPCLIEPGVQCNHCGYCQSHGH